MSKYTRIQARVIDQSIQLVNVPRIASGGRDEVRVDFAFCGKWDNLAKTAVFYQDPEWAYKILVVDNSAVVPAEALAKDGLFYFGVFGTGADGQVRTTEVVSMMVVKGAVTFQGIQPGEPTPDIYTQLMGAYGELETALAVERARLSEFFATRGGGVETFTIEGEYTTGTIKTNGVVAFVSLRMEGDPLPVGAKDSVLLPQHFDPLGEVVETSTPSSPPGGASIIPSRFNDNQGPVLEVTNYFDEEDLTDPIEFEFYYNLAGMSIPELTDLRVGPDGTIYPTAGDAIRAIKRVTVVEFTYDVFAESWKTDITYDELLGLFCGDKIVVAHLIRGDDECYTMNIDFIPERFRITSTLVWLEWSEGAEIIEIDQPESGGGGGSAEGAVLYNAPQDLTPEEQAQARANIDAASSAELNSKSNLVDGLEFFTETVGAWIKYEDGSKVGSGTYFSIYQFPNPTFKYIRAFLASSGSQIASVAFYSTAEISTDSYMAEESIAAIANDRNGSWYESYVPDGCELVVLTSRTDTAGFIPSVKLDANVFLPYADKVDKHDQDINLLSSKVLTNNTLICESAGVSSTYFETLAGVHFIRIVVEEINTNISIQIISPSGDPTIYMRVYSGNEYNVRLNGSYNRIWTTDANAKYKVYLVSEFDAIDKYMGGLMSVENNAHIKRTVENPGVVFCTYSYNNGELSSVNVPSRLSTRLLARHSGTIRASADFDSGYEVMITACNGITTFNSGWQTTEAVFSFADCEFVFITVRKMVDGVEVSLSPDEETGLVFTEDCYSLTATLDDLELAKQDVNEQVKQLSNAKASGSNLFVHDKYYSHIFIDKISASSNPIIPCQSIFDIAVSSRLGFKIVEGNVQATATAGKYIVMHGESGKLGEQVEAIDGSDASSVVMSTTSFEDLRTKYRYRSQYEKYRTPIISLEEFLYECKKYGIIPFVRYVDETMLKITKSIVGDDFILYGGNRNVFDGMIYLWGSSTATKSEIFSICETYGAPLMYAIHSNATFTDSELVEIVKGVHERGCLIGWAGCYTSPVDNKKFLDLGFDFSGSAWDVNDFEYGNLVNAKADIDFSDFETTGTVANGVLTLNAGDTVTVTELNQCFLAKGSLHILFNGKINLNFGHRINNEFTSDGTSNSWFSTYFMNAVPTFTITATEQTTISMIDYRASKC